MNGEAGKPPLTGTRSVFAALGVLLMLVSGGGTVYVLSTLDSKMSHHVMTHESLVSLILMLGGGVFFIGFLIWLFAAKVGRG